MKSYSTVYYHPNSTEILLNTTLSVFVDVEDEDQGGAGSEICMLRVSSFSSSAVTQAAGSCWTKLNDDVGIRG
jgi:hypothetical protein